MTPMEVYFDTNDDLDAFAARLRCLLNLPSENRTEYQRNQKRESANLGGVYYLFEVLGFELLLLGNMGEAEIPEMSRYSLYLLIRGGSESENAALAERIKDVVAREGISVVTDSLSA